MVLWISSRRADNWEPQEGLGDESSRPLVPLYRSINVSGLALLTNFAAGLAPFTLTFQQRKSAQLCYAVLFNFQILQRGDEGSQQRLGG